MEITTVIGCKVACKYCPQKNFVNAYQKRSNIYSMTLDVFKKCVDKIPITQEIRFSGMSEPWLNRQCLDMLLYAYKRGYRVSVFTTLVGMSVSDVEMIESVPFTKFIVHLPCEERSEDLTIDDGYLEVLERLHKSKINAYFHTRSAEAHPRVKEVLGNKKIEQRGLDNRAGNLQLKDVCITPRKRGRIRCRWRGNLRIKTSDFMVLLPDGEVLFCCQDFGLRHVLGDLLFSDYESLFGEELLFIEKGMQDDSLDILCRYCILAIEMDKGDL